jgi:hypothetical protein
MKTDLESPENSLIALENKVIEVENSIKNKQIDLKKAEESIQSAKNAKDLIDIKDFKYIEVVQKSVQVQELGKVIKQQSFNETRQNQEAYKVAKLEGDKAVLNAKTIEEQSKKSLEAATKTSVQTKQARDEAEKKYAQTQNNLALLKQNLAEKSSILKAKQSDLAKAESAVLSAQTAKNSININNFKYTEAVRKPVQVQELRKVTKQQSFNETKYNWSRYEEAQATAKVDVQKAKNAVDKAEQNVNTWTKYLKKDSSERDTAIEEYARAKNSFEHTIKQIKTEEENVKNEERKKGLIDPKDYPYQEVTPRWVSTRKWWLSGKWKNFYETRYDGKKGEYQSVIAAAEKRIVDAKSELKSWVNYRGTVASTLEQAKQKKETAENEVSSSYKTKNKYENELKSARNDLVKAENNEKSINFNNFSYTVVAQKDVEVQEWQTVTKMETFNEIRYGGKEYENALAKATTELVNAVSLKEACQREVNTALQAEANSKKSLQVAEEQRAQQEKEVGQRKLEAEKAIVFEDSAKKAFEKAGQEVENAKKAEQSINIKNFEYTVVVQKDVEVEELQTVTKLQTFNEVKFGGEVYKKAIEHAEKNFTTAQKHKADCEKELELLQQKEIKLCSEMKVIEQAISTEMEKEQNMKSAQLEKELYDCLQNQNEQGYEISDYLFLQHLNHQESDLLGNN